LRKHFAGLITYLLILSTSSSEAFIVNLNQEEIQKATKFGKDNKDSLQKSLEKIYSFGRSRKFEDGGIIKTKWYKLASMAAIEEKQSYTKPLEKSYILQEESLQIDFIVFGHTLDFAREYTAFILQEDRVVEPEKKYSDRNQYCMAKKKSIAGFPSCRTMVRTYFSYKSLDATKEAIIVLKKDGKEFQFKVDFSKFK
jgi:hypothetical protein